MIKKIAAFCLSFGLAGCVDLSPYQQRPAPVTGGYPARSVEPTPSDIYEPVERGLSDRRVGSVPRQEDAVVIALLDESQERNRQGDVQSAISTLERGVRIRPRNPVLWHQLAKLRLQQQRPVLAESLARKSLSLTTSDDRLKADNWQLIAEALKLQGKRSAALQAAEKARELRY